MASQGIGKDFSGFIATMMRSRVPSYSEVVNLLESDVERNQIDAPTAQMAFYTQKLSKNKR